MNAPQNFTADLRRQRREAIRAREIDAVEAMISRAQDYLTALRFRQPYDFAELKLCDAVCDVFEDGDVVGRRDAILDENRWDTDGNPLRGDMLNDGLRGAA